MRQLPPRHQKDGPITWVEWVILAALGAEWLFFLYWSGAFRLLGP